MADTLARLVGPKQLGNAAATEYTGPASTTTVIRDIEIDNPTAGPVDFTLSIGADAAGTRVWSGIEIPGGEHFTWTGNLVVAAAEIVQIYASAATSLVCTISGVKVT